MKYAFLIFTTLMMATVVKLVIHPSNMFDDLAIGYVCTLISMKLLNWDELA